MTKDTFPGTKIQKKNPGRYVIVNPLVYQTLFKYETCLNKPVNKPV